MLSAPRRPIKSRHNRRVQLTGPEAASPTQGATRTAMGNASELESCWSQAADGTEDLTQRAMPLNIDRNACPFAKNLHYRKVWEWTRAGCFTTHLRRTNKPPFVWHLNLSKHDPFTQKSPKGEAGSGFGILQQADFVYPSRRLDRCYFIQILRFECILKVCAYRMFIGHGVHCFGSLKVRSYPLLLHTECLKCRIHRIGIEACLKFRE